MQIWGILNLNEDSFYSGSRTSVRDFEKRLTQMIQDGADVVDLGAESTRPYSRSVSVEEEWMRLEKPLKIAKDLLGSSFQEKISIDSYKDENIERALEMGVRKINHIKGGSEKIFELIKSVDAEIVLMHSFSDPENMQINPTYSDVVQDIYKYLEERSNLALSYGIAREKIIWDFGIGFGKTTAHNIDLLKDINYFQSSNFRIMIGLSRKSFMGRQLSIENPEERLIPTIIYHTILSFSGLKSNDILRVHDVKETSYVRKIYNDWEEREMLNYG